MNPLVVLPEPLTGLSRLAHNFYWSWQPEAAALFQQLAPEKWASGIGPVQILNEVRDWRPFEKDKAFVKKLEKAIKAFDIYVGAKAPDNSKLVAYFCAEYGLHESFAQYSGGLGILAGDHCKEASDLNLPFIAVGCFYRLGFFRQLIDANGRQEHLYPHFDSINHPIEEVLHPKTGKPLVVAVDLPGREVRVRVWEAKVGRIRILLLDTDHPDNATEDKAITAQLYMRGRDMRLTQEWVLGVGGVRALRALGLAPATFHMNEGHSAFLVLELMREYAQKGLGFAQIRKEITNQCVLTIHTPVPAGNERFDAKSVAEFLRSTPISTPALLKLGLGDDRDRHVFDMTAFALRHSRRANGVSLLHGETAHKTWHPVVGIEVEGITNGVHMPTWMGPDMRQLLSEHGVNFHNGTELSLSPRADDRATWEGVMDIPDEAFWNAHQSQKSALKALATERIYRQRLRAGDGPDRLRPLLEELDPNAFWIGFARRFATYKRATLIFRNPKRLAKILDGADGKVQILFSGKAHPADGSGQAFIEEIYQLAQTPELKGRIFLIEDYDMSLGRALTGGVDMWLNNPLRPLEASGTSGMKAAANGVPNCSILDGWWDEGIEENGPRNGFAIGNRVAKKTQNAQDKFDADSLYKTLEEEVLPLYFKKRKEWIKVMKRATATSLYAFSTRRMLEDYSRDFYRL